MSEQTEQTESPKQSIRWLHICESDPVDWAYAIFLMASMSNVPRLTDGDDDLFKKASERAAHIVMQEVGRRVFEVAMEDAKDRYLRLIEGAKTIARDEDLPDDDEDDDGD